MGNKLENKPTNSRLMAGLIGFYFCYFMSYFIKLSPSIIMPVLQETYNFTSAETGFIASMYFLPYATMQLFVGPLCRKLGAGPLVGIGLVIAAAGLLVFSHGTTVAILALGRFLLGFGTSPIFIGMIYYMRGAFQSERYARYYGFAIFISALGSIVAAAPLKAILKVLPIDTFFLGIALFTFVLGIFMIVIDKNRISKAEPRTNIFVGIAKDLRLVTITPVLFAGLLLWLTQAPSLVCYQGLWCTKWTATAFPSLENLSGLSGIAISIGMILSSTVGETWVDSYKSRTGKGLWQVLVRLCFLHVVATLMLSLTKQVDNMVFFCLSMLGDVLFGFTTGSIIVQGGVFVKENTSARDNASVMGVYNCIGCISQQLSQWLTGVEIDIFIGSVGLSLAFCLTFTTMAFLFVILTILAYRILKRTSNQLSQNS
ncbi:MAG: MFS transporter [Spirochaetales bacterium]|nr:MFS transporter [Spirochaetales bacterium]